MFSGGLVIRMVRVGKTLVCVRLRKVFVGDRSYVNCVSKPKYQHTFRVTFTHICTVYGRLSYTSENPRKHCVSLFPFRRPTQPIDSVGLSACQVPIPSPRYLYINILAGMLCVLCVENRSRISCDCGVVLKFVGVCVA